MATVALNNFTVESVEVVPTGSKPVTQAYASWGMGNFLNWTQSDIAVSSSVSSTQYIYRGRLAGNYVYSTGSPPGGGATDIVIIGQTG